MTANVAELRAHLAGHPDLQGFPSLPEISEDSAAVDFARQFSDRLRFRHGAGDWLVWTGSIWKPDKTQLVVDLVRGFVRARADAAKETQTASCRRRNFIMAVEQMIRSDRRLATGVNDYDREAYLAGTPGETIDLKTGGLISPNPDHLITKAFAVTPAASSNCPIWRTFIDQTFKGDAALVRFIQQYFGYSLTGDISEQALFFGIGGGGNGKGVVANTITGIMGDYAVTAAMDTFTASRSDKHPTDLAMLCGARLVTASETEEDRAWAEARIKQLTGGDEIQARFMRQDFFSFKPTFKLLFFGNHRPPLNNVDDAARRRFNIVPFDYKPEKPDPDLEAKLRGEWPAILRWMIEGCLDWQANRLVRPPIVRQATETYFSDQDVFSQWLADQCDVEPANTWKSETSANLFADWQGYAERAGERVGSRKAFADQMARRGLPPTRATGGVRTFRGICLRTTKNPRYAED
jgi:putative DNA primase/helicase